MALKGAYNFRASTEFTLRPQLQKLCPTNDFLLNLSQLSIPTSHFSFLHLSPDLQFSLATHSLTPISTLFTNEMSR